MRGRSVTSIVAALAIVSTPRVWAQQEERPTFRSGARLVELSIVVTDRTGNAVTTLSGDDFQIFDEGKPQKIAFFSLEAGRATPPAAAAPTRNPQEFSNRIPDTGAVTIILFDQLNTGFAEGANVRSHLVKFLEQIQPSDRVGLYALRGAGSLRVLHDFTSDGAALVRAVSRLGGNVSIELEGEQDGARLDAEMQELMTGTSGESGGTAMMRHFRGVRAVATIDALESIGHHLAGVQNRKNLIWVSAGFPLVGFDDRGRSKTGEINRATRALSDANVAVYTVDARGLMPAFSGGGRKPIFTTLSMVAENQDILRSTAEETGGRAFLNTNDINGAIRRAADDARVTYVVGYYPTNQLWDGRFHNVRVKVNRPGLEVRHRKGYVATATQKQAHALRSAALQAALASPIDASGLGVGLRVDPVEGQPHDYRLTVRVAPSGIALEQSGEESVGAIDAVVAQVRADGAEGRSLDRTLNIRASGERLQQFLRDGLTFAQTVTLHPEAERLRIVVRDVRTGAVGAIGISRRQLQSIPR